VSYLGPVTIVAGAVSSLHFFMAAVFVTISLFVCLWLYLYLPVFPTRLPDAAWLAGMAAGFLCI